MKSWCVAIAAIGALLAACGGKMAPETDGGAPAAQAAYPPPISQGATGAEQGALRLSEYRALAGLGPVALDPEISSACLGHLQYLALEAQLTGLPGCLLDHAENNHDNPYYAPEHELAGLGALIACVPEPAGGLRATRAVDRWAGSLYHRIPLFHPGLVRVGVAEHSGYVCLNYEQGAEPLSQVQLIVWPADGMTDVPTTFPGRENPCPTVPAEPAGTPAELCPVAGFIMTATWFGPPGSGPIGQVHSATARGPGGTPLQLLALYADGVPGMDPVPGAMARTVALVPAAPLPVSSSFQIDIELTVDGIHQGAHWSFASGERLE